MQRLRAMLREVGWSDQSQRVAGWLNPVVASPAAPLESMAALEAYLGPGPSKRLLARLLNAGIWAGAATAAYTIAIANMGRANETVEPAYATPPPSRLVSGSAERLLPFEDLGQQGRRYVTDVLTPQLIGQVMGEAAVAQPIRVYVGFNSQPVYQTGRAELALAELARSGAFDRSVLLLVSPPAPDGSTTP